MGSTDFSSATVEIVDGQVHIRTCFPAGTLVHTKDGTKVIEDIQVGDVVLSWNEKTGNREYKRVTNIWQRTTNELYEVKLPGQEPIVTTWNHPFWSVTQSAWVETKDLKEGEILALEDGSEVANESIIHYDTEETTVYNFEVEDNHTYYVSEAGVLVHNQSTLCLPPVTGANPIKANPSGTSFIPNLLLYSRAILNGNMQKEIDEVTQKARDVKEIMDYPEKIDLPKRAEKVLKLAKVAKFSRPYLGIAVDAIPAAIGTLDHLFYYKDLNNSLKHGGQTYIHGEILPVRERTERNNATPGSIVPTPCRFWCNSYEKEIYNSKNAQWEPAQYH